MADIYIYIVREYQDVAQASNLIGAAGLHRAMCAFVSQDAS